MSGDTTRSPEGPPAVGTTPGGWRSPKNWRSPMYVTAIDIAEPIADVKCVRSVEPPYTAAWILVCDSGYPVSCIEVPIDDELISAETIKRELRLQIGQAARPVRPDPPAILPRISVVVPTNFGRPEQLLRCIEHLKELDYPDYEVIIVDNRPDDGSPLAEFPAVRVVRESVPGISAARNRGIAVATGEL